MEIHFQNIPAATFYSGRTKAMTPRILDLESREVALCRRRSVWCSWRLTVALALLLAGLLALLWMEL